MANRRSKPTLAKLTPPKLPPVLNRGRLFRQLDACRRCPVVWVSGPPGAGKTTLIASYLKARKLKFVWYQIDDRDDDVGSFFHHLHQLGQLLKGRSRRPLPRLVQQHQANLSAFVKYFFEELFRRARPPFVVVFDNYQELSMRSPLHDLLPVGFSSIPDGVNVVVSSREQPPAGFSSLQVHGCISRIRPEAFRLSLPETRAIARLRAPVLRGGRWNDIPKMHQRLRGWTAGLVLYLEHSRSRERDIASVPEEALQTIFDYLSREVIQKLPAENQRFLLETAFLPSMTVPLAETLTGYGSAGQLLAWLYRNRLFVERRESREIVYQYHPLFESALLRHARQEYDASRVSEIQVRAAQCLEKAGRFEDAIVLYGKGSDIDGQVRLIRAHAPVLLGEGRSRTLEEWIGSIPESRFTEEPWLVYWLASCRQFTFPEESESLFARAFGHFSAQEDEEGMLLSWCGVIDSIMLAWRDLSRIKPWLDRFPDLLDGRHPPLPADVEARLVCTVFTGLMWSRPEDPRFAYWTKRALDQAGMAEDVTLAASIAQYLTIYSVWTGNPALGKRVIATVRQRLEGTERSLVAELYTLMSEGLHAWVIGEPDASLQSLRKGVEIAKRHGIPALESPCQSMLTYPYIYWGDWEQATNVLRALAPEMEDNSHLMGAVYHYQAGWVAAAQGNPRLALDHVEKVLTRFVRTVGPFVQAFLQYCAGVALFDLGRHLEAMTYLSGAEEFARRTGCQGLLFACHLSRAHLSYSEGDEHYGTERLNDAMSLGRERDFVDATWWQPEKMALLCSKALEKGIEVEYVRALIRRRNLDPPPQASEAWPWAVKVRALGRFEVEVDGAPLRFARKAQRRPITLLKAIIALGGERVPLHSLADALWPDSDGDRAHQSLEVAAHRLRKLLAHREALVVSDGFASLSRRHCWVDVWSFERICSAALNATDPEALEKLGCRALELYRGRFLPDDPDEGWSDPLRKKLNRRLQLVATRLLEREDLDLPQETEASLRSVLSNSRNNPVLLYWSS